MLDNKFKYKKLTESEQKSRGILGRLIGIIADTKEPTRNGRRYSEQLWENVFNDPIMKEKIANRCCFGELNHPDDRTEIDLEKVAICLAEQPKKGEDGKLYGVFDILPTPNGRILKAFCDYGCNIGISSRGQGDLITDDDGNEAVDPDTYECECFDVVVVPGVEVARLKYVTEGLNKKELKLKTALTESLNNANEDDKKVMTETLESLGLLEEKGKEMATEEPIEEVEAEEVDAEEELPVEFADTEEVADDEEPIDAPIQIGDLPDVDFEEPVEDLPEEEIEEERSDEEIFLDFLANNFDEKQIKKVCKILDIDVEDVEEKEEAEKEVEEEPEEPAEVDSEEGEEPDEDIVNDSAAEEEAEEANDDGSEALLDSLKEALKGKADLEGIVKKLQEELANSDAAKANMAEECDRYKKAIVRLSNLARSNKELKENASKLEESLTKKDEVIANQKARISRLVEGRKLSIDKSNELTSTLDRKAQQIVKLNENLRNVRSDRDAEMQKLTESFEDSKKKLTTEITKLNESIDKANTLKESYRKLANKTVNKYIEVKAETLGITSNDIKRKLGESYTLEDIDQVCEDLKQYQLNVSRLPFSVGQRVGVRVNESKASRPINNSHSNPYYDDDVDDSLIRLANID